MKRKPAAKQKYDIIYSIGADCGCALYMNKNNLRITSGPLDWIGGCSFNDRIKLILHDFKDYIKLSDLKKVTPENKTDTMKCEIYKNEKLGCVFPHDFPLNVPIEKSYDEVSEKYRRRIERFIKNLKQKQKVLLIWFSLDIHIPDEDILNAYEKLRKKFDKNIDILVIENDDELLNSGVQTKLLNENCTKISLFAKEKGDDNADFSKGNVKLCNEIFKRYSIKKSLAENAGIMLIKMFCNLIPIKNLRKQVRNSLLYGKN